jgi:VirE N-terminal domain
MESILNRIVSRYDNYAGQANDVNLLMYLNDTSHKEHVLKIRAKATKAERDELKVFLPGITPSAICSPTRSAKNVIAHTGLICFDLDKLPPEKMNDIFNIVISIPFVAYCGLSVSGTGFWGLIPISNKAKHLQHFEAMKIYFKEMGIDIPDPINNRLWGFDVAVKDISRFRYQSFDENDYFNHSAQIFNLLFEPPVSVKKPYQPNSGISGRENPFDAFNKYGEIESLLISHGWTYQPSHDKGTRRRYSRPGKDRGVSADYCIERKILYVFSNDPATSFSESAKGYNHVAIFCRLECDNNWKLCGQKLRSLGYGNI